LIEGLQFSQDIISVIDKFVVQRLEDHQKPVKKELRENKRTYKKLAEEKKDLYKN